MPSNRTLGIIPARAGSKRLPGKNTLPLGGMPLVGHVMKAAQNTAFLDRVVVSSDDPAVLSLAQAFNSNWPLPRPAELAEDQSLAIDYVRHALRTLKCQNEAPFDIVVIIQPTSPLTTAVDIDATVHLLRRSRADSVVSVSLVPFDQHPAKWKVMKGDCLHPYLEEENGRMAEHQLPRVYTRNGAVYATRRHVIENGSILGNDCRGHLMPRERSIDINDRLDYEFAVFLYDRLRNEEK